MVKKYRLIIRQILFIIMIPFILSCSSGTSDQTDEYGEAIVNGVNFSEYGKPGVLVSVGGSQPLIAEVDTGSSMTVVNQNAVGNDVILTGRVMTLAYHGGLKEISGELAYGVVSFTTTTGQTLSSNIDTPILVAFESTPVNPNGESNQVILGVEMDSKVSAWLNLPYPYNQMLNINNINPESTTFTFGILDQESLSKYGQIQLSQLDNCKYIDVTSSASNICWATESLAILYKYSLASGGRESSVYHSLMDSGDSVTTFEFSLPLDWMTFDSESFISNSISATIDTSNGEKYIPLTYSIAYISNPRNMVNTGNVVFSTYQVLYNVKDGIIGLK